MTKDPQAIWLPSPNFGLPLQGDHGIEGQQPRWVVLHSTAGGGAVEWLTNPASGVSAHYVIKQDGSIYQLVDEADSAYANGVLEAGCDSWWSQSINPNLQTIAVEHEKLDTTNMIALTDAQQAASFALIQRIYQRWNIPARVADASGGITGHFSISPQSRQNCPGTYPWADLWTFLNGGPMPIFDEMSPIFSTFFIRESPTSWLCKPTGKHITLGMLEYYKTLSFDPQHQLPCIGLPLTEETYIPRADEVPLSYILCERGVLFYDPQHVYDNPPGSGPVYMGHITNGIVPGLMQPPLQGRISLLEAKIASAQKALA
jgi:N-acetylmuramoyl-L-alanine amidase